MANSDMETADAKNRAMRAAGFLVPGTFEELPRVLKETYESLIRNGIIVPKKEVDPPVIPMDYKWAQVSSVTCISWAHTNLPETGTRSHQKARCFHLYHLR
jgi:hypothetical protein